MLNPLKPIGVFIEYTLKPLLDDAQELLLCMQEKGFKKDDLIYAYRLMMFQVILDFIKSIAITGLLCYTVLKVLNYHPISL